MMDDCRLSRRQFLARSAMAVGAAAAAPYVVSSRVFGASERIGIGGIGVGRQGRGILGVPDSQLVAAADVNLPRAKAVGEKAKAKAFQDYRKMLELKEVDAVTIGTPDHWHALCAIHACQAGKDVYVEKPMTLTIREGRKMVEAVRKHGRVLQVGSQQRSLAANRIGCELVRAGGIGKVRKVIAHNYPSPWECGFSGQPVPEGLDWDMWCGPTDVVPYHVDLYKPRAKPGWISFRPYSGGEMTGWGSHGLDQVQWALNMDESGPVEVWTEGEKLSPPRQTEPGPRLDKACSVPKVFFRYPGDVVMELGKGPAGGAIFIGEKGTVTIDRGKFRSDPPEIAEKALKSAAGGGESHRGNWAACIKSRAKPVADVEIGHRSATVCHLANIARLLGRRLRWDPAKEVFTDDAEANTYLDRPRRKPYQIPETL